MKTPILTLALMTALCANASWYWPFGDDEPEPPRLSELMKPATDIIDNASDLAEEGKVAEAVDEYRKALRELARIELENPDRVDKPEFATLRNKRAYVSAAIDSLLLEQAKNNARPVTVTDTTELEKKFKKMKEEEAAFASGMPPPKTAEQKNDERKAKLRQALSAIANKDYEAARLAVREVLSTRPNDAAALNLRARIESELGDSAAAEMTLTQCITSNPNSPHAFYNLAKLIFKTRGDKGRATAKRYYERSCECGGEKDPDFEEQLY